MASQPWNHKFGFGNGQFLSGQITIVTIVDDKVNNILIVF
jgi:hypothetical protein